MSLCTYDNVVLEKIYAHYGSSFFHIPSSRWPRPVRPRGRLYTRQRDGNGYTYCAPR